MALSLSVENQIVEKMARLDCTAAFVSGLAQFSQSKLSQGLSGLRPLSNQDALYVLETLNRLEELAALIEPFPIAFKNPAVIRDLLTAVEDGTLRAVVIQNKLPTERQTAYVVRFRNGAYYARQDPNGQPLQTINQAHGVKMIHSVAVELVKILEQLGYRGCTIEQSMFYGDSIFELDQAWKSESIPVEAR